MAIVLAMGVVASIPKSVVGQAQSQLSAEQQASLTEAQRLSQQVNELHNKGKYDAAISLAERVLAIREKVLGKEHFLVAASVNNLALLYKDQGKYQQAEPLLKRALAIAEKALGQEHLSVATSLNNLAQLYREQGNYQQAEPLYQRSLAILEKALGQEHQNVATSINNLANLYYEQGKYQQAESLYKRALAIREKVFGQEHPSVATSLNGLALLYSSQGNYQQAELLSKRSLAIRERALGQEHPEVIYSLNSLALLYSSQRNYQQAKPLYQRSLAIAEKVFGQSHPRVATAVNNLAELYRAQENYQQAESLYKRSLAIAEKTLGQSHPSVATSLNNLALLYLAQGNYQQAEPLYQRSLTIYENTLDQEHPFVAKSLNNLAELYLLQGNVQAAIDLIQRGLEIEEKNLALIFAVGSEQRKQSYMSTFTGTTNGTISLALQFARNNLTATQLALTTVLRRKGRVLDAVADSIQILRSQLVNKPELKRLFDEWLTVLQQQSTLVYSEKTTPKLDTERFEQLEAQRQKLEEAISKQNAEFRNAIQPVELAAIQAKIPKNAALVEIVQYQPFNVKAKKLSEQRDNPRYAAVVVRSLGEPKWVDLGEASVIDKSIESLQRAFSGEGVRQRRALSRHRAGGIVPKLNAQRQDTTSLQQLARTLNKQVIEPIRPLLGDAKHLIISPDGQLTLIPFEAFIDEQGKYLIQRYTFSYLTAGRDLLRFQSTANRNSSLVVFADIDYDKQQPVAATPKSATRSATHRRSNDLASYLNFTPLPYTQEEAQQIKRIFSSATILSGSKATETAIKQLFTSYSNFRLSEQYCLLINSMLLANNLLRIQEQKY